MNDGTISVTEFLRNLDNFQIELATIILALDAFPHEDEYLTTLNGRLSNIANSLPSVKTHVRHSVK